MAAKWFNSLDTNSSFMTKIYYKIDSEYIINYYWENKVVEIVGFEPATPGSPTLHSPSNCSVVVQKQKIKYIKYNVISLSK